MSAFTTEQLKAMDPVEYARVENARINEECKARGASWWTTIPEDREFFEECGYKTAYDYVLSSARQTLRDVYKEKYNIRPRGVYSSDMTLEEVEAEIEHLLETEEQAKARDLAESQELLERVTAGGDAPLTHNPFAALLG